MLTFFEAILATLLFKAGTWDHKTSGYMRSYYRTEFGPIEGERMYQQYILSIR